MFGVTYTLSKSMDNSSNYRDIVPDTYNTSNLWGPSEYDARHIIVINYLYDLPIFKNHATLAGKLLGGWELAGQAQFQTGSPCSIASANDYAGVSSTDLGSFGCVTAGGQFWDVNALPTTLGNFAGGVGANASSAKYFSTTTVSGLPIASQPTAGTFNLQQGIRDLVYGPGFQDWNVSLYKKFTIKEKNYFEFRTEAYDFINHPNWATSSSTFNPTSSLFGEITSKSGLVRSLQLSLRYNF
jgi:hypothetical protein